MPDATTNGTTESHDLLEGIELPEVLEPLRAEIAFYFAKLPEFVEQGHEGRFALIRGSTVTFWDTFADAYQAGREAFGMERFLAQPVDSRDLERIELLAAKRRVRS
jgi:hypothetical protein